MPDCRFVDDGSTQSERLHDVFSIILDNFFDEAFDSPATRKYHLLYKAKLIPAR